jgi:hypothetical protein
MRGISVAKLTIYKYVRTDKSWRYRKAAFHPNGKIKPNVVVAGTSNPGQVNLRDGLQLSDRGTKRSSTILYPARRNLGTAQRHD